MWKCIHQLASPPSFYRLSSKFICLFAVLAFLNFSYGLVGGLLLAPPDYQQGDMFRIIYIHVPSAFLSLSAYIFMASCALLTLVWRIKLAPIALYNAGVLGAWFTFLALVTGSIWGKPTWGTWWIWDARLTSELLLLFIYLGVLALYRSLPTPALKERITSVWVLIGLVNIPIIHYSVYWWSTLHQGSTVLRLKPSIDERMLYPLLAMLVGFASYFFLVLLLRTRNEMLIRDAEKQWVRQLHIG